MDTIVVGVDDSPCSVDAARWAFEEATLRHARVRAVHAWHPPTPITPAPARPPVGLDPGEHRAAAARRLDAALRKAGLDGAGVEVEKVITQAPATQALIDAAEDAVLLVVGARGLGTFAGLALGHISHQCTLLAPCPVVIVPANSKATAERAQTRSRDEAVPV
jgi:nucleotide-binding universal stress UspA family protein